MSGGGRLMCPRNCHDASIDFVLRPGCRARKRNSAGGHTWLFPDGVGSNLPFLELGDYAQHPTGENWEKDVKVTLLHYHEHVSEVRARLKAMHAAGQSKIGLMLWYVEDGDTCTYRAHYICPKSGAIPDQVEINIRNLLADVAAAGFDTVIMRMAAQGQADPLGEGYDPARAGDSWNLFEHLHAICASRSRVRSCGFSTISGSRRWAIHIPSGRGHRRF